MDVNHHLFSVYNDRGCSLISMGSSKKVAGDHSRFFNTLSFRLQRRRRSHLLVCQETSIVEPKHSEDKLSRERNYAPEIKDLQVSLQDNAAPFVSALKDSAKQNAVSFHFPGHNRGRAAPSSLTQLIGLKPFTHDLPDLPELDNLFSPEGPILEAQQLAAKLFGSSETWFLVGGTTCGIQAAIMTTCSPGDFLILPRNSHISAFSAMVLSGVKPKYIIPEYDSTWDIALGVSPAQIDKAIQELKMEGQKVGAVFVTSPTYHGICSNLSKISQVCHSHGIPLIVDEAHGAHFGFHPHLPKSALKHGADLAVQSTHKVLCSLTQSSMLHMAGNIVDREKICRCLQMLQSTSPSNLLLASLDAARAQISENPDNIFNKAVRLAAQAKYRIKNIQGISIFDISDISNIPTIDPLRVTVGFQQLGLSGCEADEILYKDHEIVCELVGTRSITCAINLGTSEEDIKRLVSGIEHLRSSSRVQKENLRGNKTFVYAPFTEIQVSLNPRDAFFASKRRVKIGKSIGEVCGELICPYPPGIPVMIPGEIITENALDYLLHLKSKGAATITGASDPLLSSVLVCNVKCSYC